MEPQIPQAKAGRLQREPAQAELTAGRSRKVKASLPWRFSLLSVRNERLACLVCPKESQIVCATCSFGPLALAWYDLSGMQSMLELL